VIVRTEIDGRKATVAYLTKDMNPAEQKDAELIKIVFDDGEIRFAVPSEDKEEAAP